MSVVFSARMCGQPCCWGSVGVPQQLMCQIELRKLPTIRAFQRSRNWLPVFKPSRLNPSHHAHAPTGADGLSFDALLLALFRNPCGVRASRR